MSELEKKSRRIKKSFKEGVDSSVIVDNKGILEMFDGGKWYPVGPGGYTGVTKEEADILVSDGKLKPLHWYKISGFHKNKYSDGSLSKSRMVLYDDGTDSGITIYVKALSINSFTQDGYGEFYDPIIKKMNYRKLDKIRANSDLWGIWDGDNPDVEERPIYSIGEEVIWGGYVWVNKTGSIGTSSNGFNLDTTNWEKIPFSNSSCYDKSINTIRLSYTDDYITFRTNETFSSSAKLDDHKAWYSEYSPISMTPFFLHTAVIDNKYKVFGNIINDGFFLLINYKGFYMYEVNIQKLSYTYGENDYDEGVYFGFNSQIVRVNAVFNLSLCSFKGNYDGGNALLGQGAISLIGDIYGQINLEGFKFNTSVRVNNNYYITGASFISSQNGFINFRNSGSTVFLDKVLGGHKNINSQVNHWYIGLDFTNATKVVSPYLWGNGQQTCYDFVCIPGLGYRIREQLSNGTFLLSTLNA